MKDLAAVALFISSVLVVTEMSSVLLKEDCPR